MPLVLHVSMHYRPIGGGQEVYIHQLSRSLETSGWDSRVLQPNRGELSNDNILVPRIPGVQRFLPFFDEAQFAVGATVSGAHWLDMADVIVCHYAATASLINLRKKWRRKLVVLSHGVEWNVDRMNFHDRLREWNAQRLFRQVATVANDTDYLRRMGCDAKSAGGFYDEVVDNVWFIPNAVDTEFFAPPPSGVVHEDRIWLVPRQICLDRGIHLAIEAFAMLVGDAPDAKLVIVGPEREPSYVQRCKNLVRALGLMSRVRFMPPVANKEMRALYRSAEWTIIPTIRREGTSLSALESMACGTPAILTSVAGLKDIPAVHGAPTAEGLAKALRAALKRREKESIRQRAIVQQEFSLSRWSAAWECVLETVHQRALSGR